MAMESTKQDFIEQILGLLPDWLGWLVVPLTFGYFFWSLWLKQEWALLGNPGNPAFEDRIQRLREKTIAESYRARLDQLLKAVSRLFGSEGEARNGSLEAKLFGCRPWTPVAFERLLLLAVVYPLVFLLTGWLVGEKGALGDFVILAPAATSGKVILFLLLIGLAYAVFRYGKARLMWTNLLAFAFALAAAAVTVAAVAVSLTVSLAVIVAVAIVIGVVRDDVVAVAVASAVPEIVPDCDTVAVAVPVVPFPVPVTVAFAFAFAFAVAVAVVAAWAIEETRNWANHHGRLAFFWTGAWCFLIAYVALACFLAVKWGADTKQDAELAMLLFFGVLPLVNAPLDWLSFGVTRGLLRAIADGGHGWVLPLLLAVFDLVLALLFLLMVAASALAGIWAMNWIVQLAGSGPIVNLPELLTQLQTGGWRENLWIWLMLGSTLIPTAVHCLAALYAVALAFPEKKARRAAVDLQKARTEWKKRDGNPELNGNPADVQVHEDARRDAFGHLILGQTLVTSFWLFSVGGLSYLLFTHLPGWVQAGLDLLGPIITDQAV